MSKEHILLMDIPRPCEKCGKKGGLMLANDSTIWLCPNCHTEVQNQKNIRDKHAKQR